MAICPRRNILYVMECPRVKMCTLNCLELFIVLSCALSKRRCEVSCDPVGPARIGQVYAKVPGQWKSVDVGH